MAIRIGINGFGRIGRLAFRQAMTCPDVEVVGINDLIEVDYLAYLLRYDSTHRQFQGDIRVENGALVVNGQSIRITAERDPSQLRWNEVGADYVLESTGFFLTSELAKAHQAEDPTRKFPSKIRKGRAKVKEHERRVVEC